MTKSQSLKEANIILVGMMGCGKSTTGKILASSLQMAFADTDGLVERRTHLSISELFATEGEDRFRDFESRALESIIFRRGGPRVIATGGGIVLRKHNRKLLKRGGLVIWLKASAETILSRVQHSRHRPMLNTINLEEKRELIVQTIRRRHPLYGNVANWSLAVDRLEPSAVVRKIVKYLNDLRTDELQPDDC